LPRVEFGGVAGEFVVHEGVEILDV